MGKVKYNIHDVHYAPITAVDSAGVITYDTPVALAGAVSISLEPQDGDNEIFYADGTEYYVQSGVGGYEGDLEMAYITDAFRSAIYGETTDGNNNIWESTEDSSKKFALGFVIDGNDEPIYFWFLNCAATKPSVASSTNEENKTIGTDTITVTASPNKAGNIRVKTTATSTTVATWFDAVIGVPTP